MGRLCKVGLLLFFAVGVHVCDVPAQNKTTAKTDTKMVLKDGDMWPDNVLLKDTAQMDYSLKTLRGKYVYVDLWATWCYWCCKQFPDLSKIIKTMEGKNIVFVEVSLDETYVRWTSFGQDIKAPNVVRLWDKNNQMVKRCGVEHIPRFFLIDPNGKIIKADMTRPSDPQTLPYLQSLFEK